MTAQLSAGSCRKWYNSLTEAGGFMRLEPIVEHPAVICVQCHRCIIEGIVYQDVDVVENDIYCRQCADEMASFPPVPLPPKSNSLAFRTILQRHDKPKSARLVCRAAIVPSPVYAAALARFLAASSCAFCNSESKHRSHIPPVSPPSPCWK